jgi:hypothetical protein
MNGSPTNVNIFDACILFCKQSQSQSEIIYVYNYTTRFISKLCALKMKILVFRGIFNINTRCRMLRSSWIMTHFIAIDHTYNEICWFLLFDLILWSTFVQFSHMWLFIAFQDRLSLAETTHVLILEYMEISICVVNYTIICQRALNWSK